MFIKTTGYSTSFKAGIGIFFVLIVLILVAGVMPNFHRMIGPNQTPYSRRIAWENARVVNHSPTGRFRNIHIEKGSNLVLEITDGFSRGKRTTAHPSRSSIYLIITNEPLCGDYMRFSFSDGTLDYVKRAGGSIYANIDTNMPSAAILMFNTLSIEHLTADVHAGIWLTDGSILATNMNMRFERRNAEKP